MDYIGQKSVRLISLMVDRYSISASSSQFTERFSVEVPEFYKPRYNAAPSQLLPVITNSGTAGISWFYWGRPPHYARNKNLGEKIINVMVQTLQEKPLLKKTLLKNRCIVPSDGFYGWKKISKKTSIPQRFTLDDNTLFSFAALWEEFEDEEGAMVHTFTLVTTEANDLVKSTSEKMPVILNAAAEKIWLNGTQEAEWLDVLTQYPAEKMSVYTVSPRIHNPANDHPSLILPSPAADQDGNLTLFD
jgi:putative SOS response-associated peptidase YedK